MLYILHIVIITSVFNSYKLINELIPIIFPLHILLWKINLHKADMPCCSFFKGRRV